MPPKTTREECSSGSISHFAANLDRDELGADDVPELGLGQQQEVLGTAPPDPERGDHPRLRGQKQRLAALALAERLDVVREHPLEVVLRVRARDTDERPRAARDSRE